MRIPVFLCPMALLLFACVPADSNDEYVEIIEEDKPVYETVDFSKDDKTTYDTYEGLIMAGYQGWFCAGESACAHNTFYHYNGDGQKFRPGPLRNTIDLWPDVSEYEKTYEVPEFRIPSGKKACVYSAYDRSTVFLHFKWMKEYGLDGVFMQRFVVETCGNKSTGKTHFNQVLENAMDASNEYKRAICIMYDLSGSDQSGIEKMVEDAQNLYDKYELGTRNKQKYYLYENGKPLLAIWGVGFSGRTYDKYLPDVVRRLKQKGFSIMLGVPAYWRTGTADTHQKGSQEYSILMDLIGEAEVIMPWFVGRYNPTSYSNFAPNIDADIKWAREKGVKYAPLCYPGYADRNMHPANSVMDRSRGKFYWDQLSYCIGAGAKMIYVAMFDEIDEGTAIFKILNKKDVPDNTPSDTYYVNYIGGNYSISSYRKTDLSGTDFSMKAEDLAVEFQGIENDLPTDHYLWLTGVARSILRGSHPFSKNPPVRK